MLQPGTVFDLAQLEINSRPQREGVGADGHETD